MPSGTTFCIDEVILPGKVNRLTEQFVRVDVCVRTTLLNLFNRFQALRLLRYYKMSENSRGRIDWNSVENLLLRLAATTWTWRGQTSVLKRSDTFACLAFCCVSKTLNKRSGLMTEPWQICVRSSNFSCTQGLLTVCRQMPVGGSHLRSSADLFKNHSQVQWIVSRHWHVALVSFFCTFVLRRWVIVVLRYQIVKVRKFINNTETTRLPFVYRRWKLFCQQYESQRLGQIFLTRVTHQWLRGNVQPHRSYSKYTSNRASHQFLRSLFESRSVSCIVKGCSSPHLNNRDAFDETRVVGCASKRGDSVTLRFEN